MGSALPDPAAMFRDMLGQWEKMSNEVANQAMQSSEFGKAMSQMTTMSLATQNAMSEQYAKMLMGMNLPSRSDLLEVSAQVHALDVRLGRIEALLQQLSGMRPAAERDHIARPPRTRKPLKQ
jgi:hypothetical protein